MNAQAQITHQAAPVGLLNLESFELSQRIAKMLSSSTLVPEQYRATTKVKAGKDNFNNWVYKDEPNPNGLANCVIALNMANRMGADPLMVMQNLYLIEGRPAWSSQFIMASINSSGRFSALRFELVDLGEKEIEYTTTEWVNRKKETLVKKIKINDMSCVAFAIERETGERIESSKITIEMAVKEGWFTKNGSKWQTMPEQMLRYRAASFFGRVYAPELLMGLRSADEEQDRIVDVTPEQDVTAAQFDAKPLKREILAAKSPAQISALEDKVLDVKDDSAREELLKLIDAQKEKFKAPIDSVAAEVEPVKKPEPAPAAEEKPKRTTRKKTEAANDAADKEVPAQEDEQSSGDGKYENLLEVLKLNVYHAKSVAEVKAQERYADNNNWTDEQRKPLVEAMEKRIAELGGYNSKTGITITAVGKTTAVEDSLVVEKPIAERIAECKTAIDLDKLLPELRTLSGGDGHNAMIAYTQRKEILSQGDIFGEEFKKPQVSYVDAVIARIESAKSQDDINAEYSDPAFETLSDQEKQRVDLAAGKRESELQG